MGAVDGSVLVELHRAAMLAKRPGIAVVSKDAARADRVTGSRARTHQALRRLGDAGRIIPVRRDLVVLRDATGLAGATLLELVEVITPGRYLVTGGRALQIHELTDQHFFAVTVLVPTAVADFEWRGEHARYHKVSLDRLWGGRRLGSRRDRPRPVIATAERAILDAIAHPRFGVSLNQAAGALGLAVDRDAAWPARLADAARRYDVAAVARRAGLLVERIAGTEAAAPFCELVGPSPTPVLLRPGGPASGPVDRHWHVRVNADLELVLETAGTL